MKSLNDIMEDMSALYDLVNQDKCELKKAAELSNISGKYLKAYQLELAREIFISGRPNQPQLPNPGTFDEVGNLLANGQDSTSPAPAPH